MKRMEKDGGRIFYFQLSRGVSIYKNEEIPLHRTFTCILYVAQTSNPMPPVLQAYTLLVPDLDTSDWQSFQACFPNVVLVVF